MSLHEREGSDKFCFVSDVIIIGAGFSGLWTAYRLKKLGLDVQVLEASGRVGGWIRSQRQMGHTLEWGPHTLMADEQAMDCFKDLGLEVQSPRELNKRRYILWKGSRQQVPMGLLPILTSSFLSGSTKWNLLKNLFGRRRDLGEEDLSLADFLGRYLGSELVQKLADPFVSGIAAGDIRRISARSFMRDVYEETQKTGSLFKAVMAVRRRSPSGRKRMISFKEGLEELPKALAHFLGASLYLNHRVQSIQQDPNLGSYAIHTDFGVYHSKAVIVASSSYHAADLLSSLLPSESIDFLRKIFHQRVMLWNVIAERPLKFRSGFGLLVPRSEGFALLGSLWRSEIFQDGSDANTMTAAQFFAGDSIPRDPFNDSIDELRSALGSRPRILWNEMRIYERALPQYDLYHWKKVDLLRMRLPKGLFLVGNYLEGAGLTALMKIGNRTAKEVQKQLSTS